MGWSPLVHTGFLVSHATLDTVCPLDLSRTGLSPSLAGLSRTVLLGLMVRLTVRTPWCSHHGLGSSAFDRLYLRNHSYFLFLRLLRCFSSPGSPPYTMDSCTDTCFQHVRSRIQTSTGHWICAPHRGFSQLITSFFGSQCQGIRPAPFLAYPFLVLFLLPDSVQEKGFLYLVLALLIFDVFSLFGFQGTLEQFFLPPGF